MARVRPRRASYGTPGARAFASFDTFGPVDKKNALRAGALAAGTTLMMLLMSSPALALTRDDGDDPGQGLSVMETVAQFVIAPTVIFLVIVGLVMVLDRSSDREPKAKAKAKA